MGPLVYREQKDSREGQAVGWVSGESEERWALSGSCVKDKDDVRRQGETEVSPPYCMQGHLGRSRRESSQ